MFLNHAITRDTCTFVIKLLQQTLLLKYMYFLVYTVRIVFIQVNQC